MIICDCAYFDFDDGATALSFKIQFWVLDLYFEDCEYLFINLN